MKSVVGEASAGAGWGGPKAQQHLSDPTPDADLVRYWSAREQGTLG